MTDRVKDKIEEFGSMKDNGESLARQAGRKLILEQKLEIQNKVIKELKVEITEAEKVIKYESSQEIEKLMQLKNQITKKL